MRFAVKKNYVAPANFGMRASADAENLTQA